MVSFIETKLFTDLVQQYLTDDEYRQLQRLLIERPRAGNVIRGTGGVRKLRWGAVGRGKRGGYRVIYFLTKEQNVIWMLTMYPKNAVDDISVKMLNKIRKEVEND
jgi:mRNA-degrading endonuclease RelE of RelBE toxin-antitoxin system